MSKATAKSRKKSPGYSVHRPVVLSSGGMFFRPKFKKGLKAGTSSSKLFTKAVKLNPYKGRSRRRRTLRYNPATSIRSAFSLKNLTYLSAIGGGVALGFLGIPVIDRFMPQAIRDQRKWAYGALYILAGSVLATMTRKPALKTVALTFAGMGIYDILQQNLAQDLPMISTSNLLVDKMLPQASALPEPASANYAPMLAANYAPLGPSYTALSANYEAVGNDDPYGGIFQ